MSRFLTGAKKQFDYYKSLGDNTFNQLTLEELKKEFAVDSNSVAIIVKHIAGNMLSRWTNFLTEDGEKEWRKRDEEFEDTYSSKEQLIAAWSNGWNCLFSALQQIKEEDLVCIVYIRNQGRTVTEAINRQMMHYAYNIGQIVLLGKQIKGSNWNSLSIPIGQSKRYNKNKLKKNKRLSHFTDDL